MKDERDAVHPSSLRTRATSVISVKVECPVTVESCGEFLARRGD
jgi:hypothetical protein